MVIQNEVKNSVYTPIDEYIHLYNVIGNRKCVDLLKSIVDTYYNDIADNKNPVLKPIIFMGDTGSGKSIYARSFANSLTFEFKHELGTTLNQGGLGLDHIMIQGDAETCLYVSRDGYTHQWEYKHCFLLHFVLP